jgi:transposase
MSRSKQWTCARVSKGCTDWCGISWADPLSGHLFLFSNRTRTRLKALVWDGSGLWVCAKRLEKGRFRWPEAEGRHSVTMRSEELAMLVNGLDVKQTRQRNWYRRSA